MVSGILGDVLAPLVVGLVSDGVQAQTGAESLRLGLATLAPTPLVAEALLWIAYLRIRAQLRTEPGAAALDGDGRQDTRSRIVAAAGDSVPP